MLYKTREFVRQLKMLRFSFLPVSLLSMFIVIMGMNGVIVNSSSIVCNKRVQNEFQECMKQLSEVSESQEFMFAHTESKIDGVCRNLQEVIYCTDNFVNKCVPSASREQFNTIYAGVVSFVQGLCTPGSSYRKEFLKHAPCYKTTEAEQKQCAGKYRQAAEDISNELSREEKIERSCCLISGMTNCFVTVVTKSCGKEAADFLAQIFEKLIGPSVKLMCSKVKQDDLSCL